MCIVWSFNIQSDFAAISTFLSPLNSLNSLPPQFLIPSWSMDLGGNSQILWTLGIRFKIFNFCDTKEMAKRIWLWKKSSTCTTLLLFHFCLYNFYLHFRKNCWLLNEMATNMNLKALKRTIKKNWYKKQKELNKIIINNINIKTSISLT